MTYIHRFFFLNDNITKDNVIIIMMSKLFSYLHVTYISFIFALILELIFHEVIRFHLLAKVDYVRSSVYSHLTMRNHRRKMLY